MNWASVFYRVCVETESTLVICSTCHKQWMEVGALTPFGVALRLHNHAWRRLSIDWYTLWKCPYCEVWGVGPPAEDPAIHFGRQFTTPEAYVEFNGFVLPIVKRKQHDDASATKGESGEFPQGT